MGPTQHTRISVRGQVINVVIYLVIVMCSKSMYTFLSGPLLSSLPTGIPLAVSVTGPDKIRDVNSQLGKSIYATKMPCSL